MSDEKIPVVSGLPFLGSFREFVASPLYFLTDLINRYGPIVRFTLFGMRVYAVADPALVREILVTKVKHFPKEKRDITILRRFLGKGLLTSQGDLHRQQRKLMQPAFHPQRISSYAEVMTEYTKQLADNWQAGQEIDICQEMMALTMYIVSKTLFDADRDDISGEAHKIEEAIKTLQEVSNQDFTSPILWPEWVPIGRNRRRTKARTAVHETIESLINERRDKAINGQIQDTGDLMSMLLLAQDEEGQGMDDQQVRDEVTTLFVAGHETTSNALTWTWYLLSQHPAVEARLHAELDRVLAGRTPTLDDLQALPYTLMVIKEAMRLYPPAWVLSVREVPDETELGPHTIPAGSVIFLSPFALHRQPDYFPDPEKFDPERFSPENEASIPRYGYIPFGAGPRVCIGNSFAMMEAQLIVATLAQRFCFELIGEAEVELNPLVTLSVVGGLPMRVRLRP